jgi:hypothetical protein
LGDVTSILISDINHMKRTNTMNIRSIAAVTASVAASVMLLTVAYGVSDAIISAPEPIETAAVSHPNLHL